MRETLQNLALVLFGILLVCLVFEAFPRIAPKRFVPPGVRDLGDAMERNRQAEDFFTADSELGFKVPPNTDFVVKHPDYTIRIKTHLNLKDAGFRGGILGGPAWGVAVGDSFTFGMGVEHEETWSGLLAKYFQRDILNLGIPAQAPPQYTRVLKRYGLPMKPRIVFYGVYFNDLEPASNVSLESGEAVPFVRYLRDYSYAFNLIRQSRLMSAAPLALAHTDNAEMSVDAAGLRRMLEDQNTHFDERWTGVARQIDDAVTASQNAGAQIVVLYLPSRWEVYWDSLKASNQFSDSMDVSQLRKALAQHCETHQLACLDLVSPLKTAANKGRHVYLPIDGHWTREGNQIVAEAIQSYLVRNGFAGRPDQTN
ncbi:MAG TPA: hypothetical protein VIB79_13055 [Candidatus Binatia bacterium]